MSSELPQLVVHVGTHKTGTTLLQRYLGKNLDALESRRVFYVNRLDMADYVSWGDRLSNVPHLLRDRIDELSRDSRYNTLFVSHEDLIGHPFLVGGDGRIYPSGVENIEALGRVLAGYPVRTMLSIRPQHEFLESYYVQSIQEGGHLTFEQWLGRVNLDRLSYRPLVDALERMCGAGNVNIIDFGRISEGPSAFLMHWLRRIDPCLDMEVNYAASHNRSLSAQGQQMALAVNQRIRSHEKRRAVRFFLQRNYSNADYPRAVLLSDEMRSDLEARYSGEYAELRPRAADSAAEPDTGTAR